MEGLPELRPSWVCRQLLLSLEATEGRRRKRKRDTSADSIGIELKRSALVAVVTGDPEPDRLEEWLLDWSDAGADDAAPAAGRGARLATARALLEEWRLARDSPAFRAWLAAGARSDDRPAPRPDSVNPRDPSN